MRRDTVLRGDYVSFFIILLLSHHLCHTNEDAKQANVEKQHEEVKQREKEGTKINSKQQG